MSRVRVLLDRDSLIRDIPAVDPPVDGPFFPGRQVQIFLYFMGNAVTALHRGDFIALSQSTVMMRDRLLIPLMLAENGIQDETSAKRLVRHLSK